MPTQEQMHQLVDRLNDDSELARELETDPITTLRREGFDDVVAEAERERERIGRLVDRIYSDDAFRARLENDPVRELSDLGFPDVAMEPVLLLAGAPPGIVERVTADVEAHLSGKPAAIAAIAATLGTLAFAQQASAGSQPANASLQLSQPALAQTQISQPARAQAQISQAQLAKPAITNWQGVQAQQVTAQGSLLRLLGLNRSGR
jgi:hypothetical protein